MLAERGFARTMRGQASLSSYRQISRCCSLQCFRIHCTLSHSHLTFLQHFSVRFEIWKALDALHAILVHLLLPLPTEVRLDRHIETNVITVDTATATSFIHE